jgi:hypothetical protein
LADIILARNNRTYPSVAPTSQSGFWNHRAQEFWFPILSAILDPQLEIEHIKIRNDQITDQIFKYKINILFYTWALLE